MTVPVALAYVLLAFLATPAYTDVEVLIDVLDDHLIVALLIVLVPFGIFHWSWQKTVMGLEAAIPEFLNRLSGINQVGLTLAQAITIVVRADLGVLTYEIKKIKRDIDWGASVQDALVRFEERIRTPTIARAVTLITTASRMTGGIGDVLNIAARDAAMSETLKRERRGEMFIYVTIVYLVFIVFLFVVAVIDAQFLSALAGVDALAAGSMPGGLSFGNTPIATFERLLFHACLIQALFSGLIAGEMGRVAPGGGQTRRRDDIHRVRGLHRLPVVHRFRMNRPYPAFAPSPRAPLPGTPPPRSTRASPRRNTHTLLRHLHPPGLQPPPRPSPGEGSVCDTRWEAVPGSGPHAGFPEGGRQGAGVARPPGYGDPVPPCREFRDRILYPPPPNTLLVIQDVYSWRTCRYRV
ncbi:type II secretion system F family protein [Methanoculleus sp. 10]|uniref:type II secretion system F family protein n=1 Tax=Methanoculleus sp. 10 TaxID=430615 RepID=UPI0034492F0F